MRSKVPPESLERLRDFLASHPEDLEARMQLCHLLVARGERAAARGFLLPLEGKGGRAGAQATAQLAVMDEEEGLTIAATVRWERLLADDVDHPEARARLARLRAQHGRPVSPAAAPAPTLASPEGVTLLRYEILRELGRGGTSTVYLARDQALGISLALKVLHPQLAAAERSEACRRFFQEARVAAGLRHPGVVAIYDLDEPTRTLVMEYLAGGSLRDRLRTGGAGLPLDEARALARSMLSALSFVHTRGVVHGDLTPRNVLFRQPGEAVLADFGNARLLETGSGELAGGTPMYLAPEQLRGGPSSPAADLFSAGALLWEAVTGRPMRAHGDLIANRLEAPALPEGAAMKELIDALTRTDPSDRPETAAAALRMVGH
jgi:serine/threonine protein kinase